MKTAIPSIACGLVSAAAILALTPAGAAGRDKDAWKAAQPSGRPISCVRVQDISETRVRDDRTIDFYMRNRTVYRNVLPQSCPQLGFEQRFSYRTTINQLCAINTITVLTQIGSGLRPGVTCGLGQFQPVTGAPR